MPDLADEEPETVVEEEEKDEPDPDLWTPDNGIIILCSSLILFPANFLFCNESDPAAEMGDQSKIASDADVEKAGELKAKAMEEQSAGNHTQAIQLFTEAIKANPGLAMLYVSRLVPRYLSLRILASIFS